MRVRANIRTRRNLLGRTLYFARVEYRDPEGVRHELTRQASSRRKARALALELAEEVKQSSGRLSKESATVADALALFSRRHAQPARYSGGQKVSGYRQHADVRRMLALIEADLGSIGLRSLSWSRLHQWRSEMAERVSRYGKPLSRATINRRLSMLRRVLNVAVREGLILRNPFGLGEGLISAGSEQPRERTLTRDEEQRLLRGCVSERERLILPLLIALDTGLRFGEIHALRWSDADLSEGTLTVRAMNSKTLRERSVPVTRRVSEELRRRRGDRIPDAEERIIPESAWTLRTNWRALRKVVGVSCRFHDLRHTAATRLVQSGLSLAEVGRILGHASIPMTYRYISATEETLSKARMAMERFTTGE